MVRTLRDVLAAHPPHRRADIDRRFNELVDEVESLKELRRISAVSQGKIAKTLKISQPAVSKIEKQTDMYLSTLRGYVEAIGGELDLIIRLPERRPVKIKSLDAKISSETTPDEVFGSLHYDGPAVSIDQMGLGETTVKQRPARNRP